MRRLLVVVDMQNDFIDGSLGTKEAEAIVDNVVKVIGTYDPKDIFATRDTHPENYLETQEGRNLPVVHCVKNTPGWELNEKVVAALGDAKVIDKPTFGSRTLAEELEAIAAKEEIEVTLGRSLHRYLCRIQCTSHQGIFTGNPGKSHCILLCGCDSCKP